ncbi:MAG: LamG domain-containing protein, partial [Phycisphaerae bacterium]
MTSHGYSKLLGTLVVAAAIGLLLVATGTARAALRDDLEAYWSLDYTLEDKTGNGHDGTFSGDAGYSPDAVLGDAAVTLDGNGDKVTAQGIDIAEKSFSLSLWVKRSRANTQEWVLGQGTSGSTDNALHVGFRGNNQFSFAFYGDDLNVQDAAFTDTANYHHFICTYDSTSNMQTVYLDGAFVGNKTAGNDFQATGDFWIGCRQNNTEYYQGLADEVGVWTRTLSPTEVGQLYNGGAGLDPLVKTNIWDFALNPDDGNWTDTDRWSEGVLPAADHHAMIKGTGAAAGSDVVTLDTPQEIKALTLATEGGDSPTDTILQINTGADLTVLDDITLGNDTTAAGPNIIQHNDGTVTAGGNLAYGNKFVPGEGGTYNLAGGSLEVQGTILKADDAVHTSELNWDGGTLRNLGSYASNLDALQQKSGAIQPGASIGTTLIDNDYTVGDGTGTADATWDMELNPDEGPGDYDIFGRRIRNADRINVTGTLEFLSDSNLALSDVTGNNWTFVEDDMVFVIGEYGTLVNTFGTTNVGDLGASWEVD